MTPATVNPVDILESSAPEHRDAVIANMSVRELRRALDTLGIAPRTKATKSDLAANLKKSLDEAKQPTPAVQKKAAQTETPAKKSPKTAPKTEKPAPRPLVRPLPKSFKGTKLPERPGTCEVEELQDLLEKLTSRRPASANKAYLVYQLQRTVLGDVKTLSLDFPADLLDQLDAAAKSRDTSRANLLRTIVADFLAK